MCGTLRQEASVPSVGLRGLSRPTGRQFEEREVDKIRVSDFVLCLGIGKAASHTDTGHPPISVGGFGGGVRRMSPLHFRYYFFFSQQNIYL